MACLDKKWTVSQQLNKVSEDFGSCHPSSVILCDSNAFTHRGPSGCNKSKPQILTAKLESLQLIIELNPLYSIGFLTGLPAWVGHMLEVLVGKETE